MLVAEKPASEGALDPARLAWRLEGPSAAKRRANSAMSAASVPSPSSPTPAPSPAWVCAAPLGAASPWARVSAQRAQQSLSPLETAPMARADWRRPT